MLMELKTCVAILVKVLRAVVSQEIFSSSKEAYVSALATSIEEVQSNMSPEQPVNKLLFDLMAQASRALSCRTVRKVGNKLGLQGMSLAGFMCEVNRWCLYDALLEAEATADNLSDDSGSRYGMEAQSILEGHPKDRRQCVKWQLAACDFAEMLEGVLSFIKGVNSGSIKIDEDDPLSPELPVPEDLERARDAATNLAGCVWRLYEWLPPKHA